MAKKTSKGVEVDIKDIKTSVRDAIIKRYGSVAKFLNSKDADKFGGTKIRCYLYNAGPINFEVLSKLSKYLGVGKLRREIFVTRSYKYLIEKNSEE